MNQSVVEVAAREPALHMVGLRSLRELAAKSEERQAVVQRILGQESRAGHVAVAAFQSSI